MKVSFDSSKFDQNIDFFGQLESPKSRPREGRKKVLTVTFCQLLIVYNRAYEC